MLTFANTRFGYSLQYPATYFDRGESSFPAAVDEQHFASEDVHAPLELSPDGLWLIVRVDTNVNHLSLADLAASHLYLTTATVRDVRQLEVAGEPAIQQVEDDHGAGHEYAYCVMTYVIHNDRLFTIEAVTFAEQAFSLHREEYNEVVASFRFD
jgi:hypothetical protein